MKDSPWNDLKVRQAINLGLDREGIVNVALQGRGVISALLYPEGPWGLPKAELAKKPGYAKPSGDITEAKRLLSEAGLGSEFKSTLTARMDLVESYRSAELFKTNMSKLGIDLTIELKESAGYFDALDKQIFDIAIGTKGSHLDDPDVLSEGWVTGGARNNMGYSDPKVDEMSCSRSNPGRSIRPSGLSWFDGWRTSSWKPIRPWWRAG